MFFAGGCLVLAAGWAGWHIPKGLPTALLGLFALLCLGAVWATYERQRLVREAPLPHFLKRKLRQAYPHLSQRDAELVERGLRQFFLACLRSRGKFVAMPSRVVDSMWHEFILHTAAYRNWCTLVLGRFMDHMPAEAMRKPASHARVNDGLRRAWYWACRDESIRPREPSRLPLLFALDAKLGITNGFHYQPDCRRLAGDGSSSGAHCGESFSDGSYSGDADHFGGSETSSSGDSSDASDAGGGDGCGGGD
ncbi:MAG: hypothetical protein EAZ34_07480 [Polaromonas sp.]|nr:MAG: hypothetical protein EAZ34_07480 [Polaromonas sp.]